MNEILGAVVQQRIVDLLHDRRWYRRQPKPIYWFDLARDTDRELRILLRLVRQAKTMDPHPKTASWTNGELAEAFGK